MAQALGFKYAESKTIAHAHVSIDASVVTDLFDYTLLLQQQATNPPGFNDHAAPKKFAQEYYQEAIVNHLKEFCLKYHIISFLYQQLHANKILIVGEPRLTKISLQPRTDAEYVFECTPAPKVAIRDWRYLPFKAPLRKKYQDIDKQATLFITQEQEFKKNYTQQSIAPGDWVLFEVTLLNQKQKPLVSNFTELLWLQMSNEETGEPFRSLFIGKKKGENFSTNHLCLQEFFGSNIDVPYTFNILIKEILPAAYFCFDLFKEQFKLKSTRKTHQKIIEIYSFRNDISLHRSMAEEALALLAKTYPFDIPTPAVMRQKNMLIEQLQNNQDYTIYKLQHDFDNNMHMLAEKQVREHMLADYFAHQENISVTLGDMCQYLNLTKRQRTKEFVYFKHQALNSNEEEVPLQHALLCHICRKEKAVNHLLYHWGKP